MYNSNIFCNFAVSKLQINKQTTIFLNNMEIIKFFKESNEVQNLKDDFVEIKMNYEDYVDLMFLLDGIRIKNDLKQLHLNQIERNILEKVRETEVKEVWY